MVVIPDNVDKDGFMVRDGDGDFTYEDVRPSTHKSIQPFPVKYPAVRIIIRRKRARRCAYKN